VEISKLCPDTLPPYFTLEQGQKKQAYTAKTSILVKTDIGRVQMAQIRRIGYRAEDPKRKKGQDP